MDPLFFGLREDQELLGILEEGRALVPASLELQMN